MLVWKPGPTAAGR